MALICAGLGDKDCAIEALNRMADIKDPRVRYYLIYPELAIIRGDPRLKALRKQVVLRGAKPPRRVKCDKSVGPEAYSIFSLQEG